LVRGNWGRSKTSCPWASRASSVLGSSVPGIDAESKRRGFHACNGNGLERGTRRRKREPASGGRAGLVPERSNETRRRWNAPWFVGVRSPSREAVQTRILVARSGEWVSVHAFAVGSRQWVHELGVEEGTACAQSASNLRSEPLGLRVSAPPQGGRRWGHSRRTWTRCSLLALGRSFGLERAPGGGTGAGLLGSWPRQAQ